ncbi:hypothetical protein GF407_06905 [candidate division KSB1 bacterium]|nr:hypothetical protein [candidate division KSB1 bacterium]
MILHVGQCRTFCILLLLLVLFACQRDLGTDSQPLPRLTRYYGYTFTGWEQPIPNSALDLISYVNTVVIDGESDLRENLQLVAEHNMRAVVDISAVVANTIPDAWGNALDSLATGWQNLESHVTALLLIRRPFASQHLVGQSRRSFWTTDELDECVGLVKRKFPALNTLIVYLPSQQLATSLPALVDAIGIEYFPFRQTRMPTRTEFRQGWQDENGIIYEGIDFYINEILTSKLYRDQPLYLFGQCFGDIETWKLPPSESQQWYYDVVEEQNVFGALIWWRAFEPSNTPQYSHGIFPFVLENGTLLENLPAVIKLHREIGERIDRPWQE